jgi:chromosome condensin MukBEF MukE localization factor
VVSHWSKAAARRAFTSGYELFHVTLAVRIVPQIKQALDGMPHARRAHVFEALGAHAVLLGFQDGILKLVLEHKVEVEVRIDERGFIHRRNEQRLLAGNLARKKR